MSYSIHSYGRMMADPMRLASYFEALRRTVKPGDVVVDIGSGTGVHALLAAQLGARRVVAIEPSGAIEAGRAIARANGLDDRIEFVRAPSQTVELGEPADVVVSDLRGRMPVLQDNLGVLVDARRRFLGPDGTFIPSRDDLVVAGFENPSLYDTVVAAWDENPLGLDMSAGRELAVNDLHSGKVEPEHLITDRKTWATLDYRSDLATGPRGEVALRVERGGTVHGLAVWFDATVVEGVTFSTGPGSPDSVYGRTYVVLPAPVEVAAGDTIEVEMRADLAGPDYVWTWRTRVLDAQGRARASFEQSTFQSWPLTTADLSRRGADRVVELNVDGQIRRAILNALDGRASFGATADALQTEFPHEFAARGPALARVADVAHDLGA